MLATNHPASITRCGWPQSPCRAGDPHAPRTARSSWDRFADHQHAGGSVGVLPRTRRRGVHASRNPSRAHLASLR